ncbi:MAG: hypothetical protein GY870_10420 [archaeon]|nr:hypothetical protein [archaeon]
MKKAYKVLFLSLFLLSQPFLIVSPQASEDWWDYSMIESLNSSINLFSDFNATSGFKARQQIYLEGANTSEGKDAQNVRVYLNNTNINETNLLNSLNRIYNYKDCLDFDLNSLLRLIYLDLDRNILSTNIKNNISDAFGKCKYWYDEPSEDTMIYYTENHQILYHTAELLIGQLYPNDTFTNNGKNGTWHMNHAKPLVNRWLDWKGQFGFSEWHSNTYLEEDITALVNLVDFSNDTEIATKAAMVLDLIAFGFFNNYFNGTYATSHGRAYDSKKVGTSLDDPPNRDSTSEAAWIMLGIGKHDNNSKSSNAACALATSDNYAPPPILEDIANDTITTFEHWERNNIDFSEGPKYDIGYTEDDMMFWWESSGPMAPETIEVSFDMIEKYGIDPNTLCGPQLLVDFLKGSAFIHGQTLSEYSKSLEIITKGVCLESADIYTYRTPYYQLSGAQDHMKGMNSMQEHIWQATLGEYAFVYANSPTGLTHGFNQNWMGGILPRATLYKNVGIIQYDRESLPLEGEIALYALNLFTGMKFDQHAYFPQWAFDEVLLDQEGWTFGRKGDGYIGLYSFKPTSWVEDYELRIKGRKNAWITELGSIEEYGNFNNFTNSIKNSEIIVIPEELGYDISYESPTQGVITVSWDDPLIVKGSEIDLGPYPRFNNTFCEQNFGTDITHITYNSQSLDLNFDVNGISYSRIYSS